MKDRITRKVIDFFDKKSGSRDSGLSKYPSTFYEQFRRQQTVLKLLDARSGECILDVGCGNGRDLIAIARKNCFLVGVDVSPKMIEAASDETKQKQLDISFILADGTKLPFKENAFDRVLCSETLEHIPDWKEVIKEIARTLRPRGRTVISAPNQYSIAGLYRLIQEKIIGTWEYHPYDCWKNFRVLSKELAMHGFDVETINAASLLPSFLLIRMNLSRDRVIALMHSIEKKVHSLFPFKFLGYMVVVQAEKTVLEKLNATT